MAEHIIDQHRATETNYFTQNAAYFGFVACSLSLITATKLLDPENAPAADISTIKDDITEKAVKLFGLQPPSPFDDYHNGMKDERLWGLHYAFVDHWLRRDGHVPSIRDIK